MKYVAIYTRKSTDAGPDKEANSLAVQRQSAERFIEMRGKEDWGILEERFDDNKASGGTMDRPAMKRLMQAIKDGRVQILIIHRLDRISRSVLDFLQLLVFLEEYGVALICVTQNFDTSDPMGKMAAQMLLSFAEFERSMISSRVTDRIHTARRLGRFIGGRPILGYDIKSGGGALEINELEAIRVRAIFLLYLELRSIKAVVLELNKRGWNNKKWITREGKVTGGSDFTISTLHKLLTNLIYIGKVTLKEETFEGQHEGIVDSKIFGRVQAILSDNDLTKGQRNRNSHDALLKGLLKCKACGTAFVHTGTKKKSKYYRYYTCTNKRLNGAHVCPSPSIPAGEIEALVSEQLMSIGTNPELQKMVHRQLVEAIDTKQAAATQIRQTATKQLNRITKELASSRNFGASESLILHLEQKRQEAENALENSEKESTWCKPSKDDVIAVVRDMAGLWPTFSTGEKCAFVKTLVRQVEYDADEGSITLLFNDEGFVPSENEGGDA